MKILVTKNKEEASQKAFKLLQTDIINGAQVLGLATGSSPLGLYQKMTNSSVDYSNLISINLDEYVGISRDHEQSYYTFMHENLFNYIDCPEENIHVPEGNTDDHEKACVDYENALKQHVVDIQVLGIGSDGHIAFNEPGCPFDSETHLMELTEQTRSDNARFFDGDINQVPTLSITQGLGSIMRAKKILLIATGANKADAVWGMLKGEKTTDCPASILQDHADVTVILDRAAASRIA